MKKVLLVVLLAAACACSFDTDFQQALNSLVLEEAY